MCRVRFIGTALVCGSIVFQTSERHTECVGYMSGRAVEVYRRRLSPLMPAEAGTTNDRICLLSVAAR
jgi:hypothetical protein